MKIKVNVKPGAGKDEVVRLGAGHFKVLVMKRAVEGKANRAVRDALACFFGVPKSRVTLVHGQKGREKFFQIDEGQDGL